MNPQDSQSELRELYIARVHRMLGSKPSDMEMVEVEAGAYMEVIEAYVTTRVKEARNEAIRELSVSSKSKDVQLKRNTALMLRNKGLSLSKIARVMGFKNKSSVQSLLKTFTTTTNGKEG